MVAKEVMLYAGRLEAQTADAADFDTEGITGSMDWNLDVIDEPKGGIWVAEDSDKDEDADAEDEKEENVWRVNGHTIVGGHETSHDMNCPQSGKVGFGRQTKTLKRVCVLFERVALGVNVCCPSPSALRETCFLTK